MTEDYAFLTLSTVETDEAVAMSQMYAEFVKAVTQASPLGSDALPGLQFVLASQTLEASDFHEDHTGEFDVHLHFNRHGIPEELDPETQEVLNPGVPTGYSIDILIDCSHCTFDPITVYALFIGYWTGEEEDIGVIERLYGPEQDADNVPKAIPSKNGVRLWLAIYKPTHMFGGHDPKPVEDEEEVI